MDRLLPWLRKSGWAYILLAVALAGLGWRIASRPPAATQPQGPPTAATISPRSPVPKVVHVTGAVRKPGVYEVPEDGRVQLALRLAGGPTGQADLAAINLAAPLQDGQQVLVPTRVASVAGVPAAGNPGAGGGPISLSSATADQLDALDGIGPTLAARIVAWRNEHGGFASVDQLLDVPGIGQTRLDAIRAKLTP
jgi:competence protein ComEA